MIAHGDEFGRTQQGNNNVYCQDNELAWVDWELDPDQLSLLDFTRHLLRLRAEHPVFRRRRFFAGSADHGGESELGDIAWFEPDGQHMDEQAWANGFAKSLMVFLNGLAIQETDARGGVIRDDSFLVLFNAHFEAIDFTLPADAYGDEWLVEVDTAVGTELGAPGTAREASEASEASAAGTTRAAGTTGAPTTVVATLDSGGHVSVQARSVVVLRHPRGPSA